MKRIALAGLLISFMAGTATSQTPDKAANPFGEPSTSKVILKGVSSDAGPIVPAAAASILRGKQETVQDSTVNGTELANCNDCNQDWTDCCCDRCDWTFWGEWLLLQPRGADPVFAARALNCDQPPNGPAEQIDFGAFNGFEFGFAKTLCDGCSDIAFSWTHFEANEEDRAAPTTGGDVLLPLLFHPSLLNCPLGTSTRARASSSIDFDRVNIDYRRYVDCGCLRLDWLVGFGYGELIQDLRAIYDEGRVEVNSESWGYGARIGGGGEYGVGRFRGFAHGDLTLLASNAKARYQTIDIFDGEEVDFTQDLDRIIPVVDLEVGVAMDLCRNTVLKVGYTYSIWFNVVTTPVFVSDVQHGDIDGNSGDTLTFDGVFARVEINW